MTVDGLQYRIAGEYAHLKNSPLAEQKNRFLRLLETQASYMDQPSFLSYTRYFLHCLNKLEAATQRGEVFFRRVEQNAASR